jgi:endonuclease/exonuclease/phosphatase family metal-dependent hydrolase
MEVEGLSRGLANLLAPFLAPLLRSARGAAPQEAPALVRAVWSKLSAPLEKDERLKESAVDLVAAPEDPDALACFRVELKKLLVRNRGLANALEEAVRRAKAALPESGPQGWRDLLGREEGALARLEMLYLLRSGKEPRDIAVQFGVDPDYPLRVNEWFSLAGVAGLLSGEGVKSWLDRLDRGDPILRRIEMIRLLRSGTPARVVGRAYDALEDYIERIHERFSRDGVMGILTEEDFDRFRSLHPATVRVCSFNLHGTHGDEDGQQRFRRIARGLAPLDPHAACFQEVVSGAGIEDTGEQIARWISAMTGYHYRSQFAYCHLFMEKYPEGVGLALRSAPGRTRTIDLTRLPGGLAPAMPRNALAAEADIFGRRFLFVSVHLDHSADPQVRLAQAQKLVSEIDAEGAGASCSILAGDFNDEENSPAIDYLRSAGYRDAYRACHRGAGTTYPAGNPEARIDYILVRGHAAIVASGLLANDPELSDHVGLFAEIR